MNTDSLALSLDHSIYQAGTSITGIIALHLSAPVKAQSLTLRLTGSEHAHWTVVRTKRQVIYQRNNVKVKVTKQAFPVFAFKNGEVAAGDYSFPFAIELPASLPGTFHYRKDSTWAELKYHLAALLENTAVPQARVELHLQSQLLQHIVNVQNFESVQPLICCCSQGEVRLGIQLDKSAYAIGEQVQASVEVDNTRSSLDVLRVRTSLLRTVRLISVPHHFPNVIREVISEVVTELRVARGQEHSPFQVTLPVGDVDGELHNTTTLQTRHIACIYSVRAFAEMNGRLMCCSPDTAVEQVVTVYSTPPLAEDQQALPGWNPTVMPLVQFSMVPDYQSPNPT